MNTHDKFDEAWLDITQVSSTTRGGVINECVTCVGRLHQAVISFKKRRKKKPKKV